MDRLVEFVGLEWELFTLLLALIVALIFTESRKAGKTVSPQGATLLINRSDAVVVDIRDLKEFNEGHIVGAINIPLANFDGRVTELEKYKTKPLIIACKMGQQSGIIGKRLSAKGFTDVQRLQGGMTEWLASNLPVVK